MKKSLAINFLAAVLVFFVIYRFFPHGFVPTGSGQSSESLSFPPFQGETQRGLPSIADNYNGLGGKGRQTPLSLPLVRGEGDDNLVTRVIDGDTIQIESGVKVRYIGMNTPESVDPRRKVQCFGKEASEYNKDLVLNKKVKLVKDISETDKYGRLLRYVYLADGTFVNLKLVRDGYAQADTFPPDVAHAEDFVNAQRQAREEGLGLWGKCQ